jgi:hypothetical protein
MYLYKICPQRIEDKSSDLRSLFKVKIDELKTVGDRMLQLNENSEERDCLLYKEMHGQNIFCTLVRLVPAQTVGMFPDELLEKEQVLSNELPRDEIAGWKYKRLTYIYISDTYLAININSAKNFETYVNEIIQRGGDNLFLLNPYIEQQPEITLSDIKRIRLGSGFNVDIVESNTIWSTIKAVPKAVLNVLIENGVVTEDLLKNDLVAAEVNLKFQKKPKEMEKDEYERLLSNALSLNRDGVVVEKKKGGTINAGDFHKRKTVAIECLLGDLLNEKDLKMEMAKFITEEGVKSD